MDKEQLTFTPVVKVKNSSEKELRLEAKKWKKEVKKEMQLWINFSRSRN